MLKLKVDIAGWRRRQIWPRRQWTWQPNYISWTTWEQSNKDFRISHRHNSRMLLLTDIK